MLYYKLGHLMFIPDKVLKDNMEVHGIFVFSFLINNKVYQTKNRQIGYIIRNERVRKRTFMLIPEKDIGFSEATLFYISMFIGKLNRGEIKFDWQNGELK